MVAPTRKPRKLRIASLCAGWLFASSAAAGTPLVENPCFEAVAPLAAPPKANAQGQWVLKSDLLAPAQWTLSAAYPGELQVVEDGAAEGQRFLRIAAGPNA